MLWYVLIFVGLAVSFGFLYQALTGTQQHNDRLRWHDLFVGHHPMASSSRTRLLVEGLFLLLLTLALIYRVM
jgi:hypothetical protein